METNKINDLIKSGFNITVAIGLDDLRTIINETVLNTKKELQDTIRNDKEETFLTINQVAEMLSVDKSTLWRWNKTGYLKHIETGGGRRYKRSSVKAVINGGV